MCLFCFTKAEQQASNRAASPEHAEVERQKPERDLTFELSGRRRQDARPGLATMYRVPPDRAWWPAVGAPLERGVSGVIGPSAPQIVPKKQPSS